MAYYRLPSDSNDAPPNPTAIIGPEFCAPYPVDLAIVRKVMSVADKFTVTDVNGNIIFKLKGSFMSLRDRRVLLDAAGNPIVTLRRKVSALLVFLQILSTRDRWKAFRGESTEPNDLIFTLKRSSYFQLKTKLDVFLANNTSEQVCDFKVKGSWFERSCAVYVGDSHTVVAQMRKKYTVQSILLGKDNFMVTVYPDMDSAFIVALLVILHKINRDSASSVP